MSVFDLISKLERIDIRFWVENDRLHYDAPAGPISDVHAELIQRNSELLKNLLKPRQVRK